MNKKNINHKTDESKSSEAVKAYKPRFNDVKSDTNGSYTGCPEKSTGDSVQNEEKPIQDADDL